MGITDAFLREKRKDKKEKNDWKARMLKSGFGNMGLEMPEDWNSLDEETKEARLNAVIAQCIPL